MTKHFTCDGPRCARVGHHPWVRWYEISEHTVDKAQRRLFYPLHFCGLRCLGAWIVANSEPGPT